MEQHKKLLDLKTDTLRKYTDGFGLLMVEGFHLLALFAIGAITVWAAIATFLSLTHKGHADIEDILLLFIYLELGAMVGVFFKTSQMPVRFLIYVAITALTRMMIGHISAHHTPNWGILMIAGAILILVLSELLLRIGSHRFPVNSEASDLSDTSATKNG